MVEARTERLLANKIPKRNSDVKETRNWFVIITRLASDIIQRTSFSFSGTCPVDFMELKKLTHEEENVIIHKGTEMPFTGEY